MLREECELRSLRF